MDSRLQLNDTNTNKNLDEDVLSKDFHNSLSEMITWKDYSRIKIDLNKLNSDLVVLSNNFVQFLEDMNLK